MVGQSETLALRPDEDNSRLAGSLAGMDPERIKRIRAGEQWPDRRRPGLHIWCGQDFDHLFYYRTIEVLEGYHRLRGYQAPAIYIYAKLLPIGHWKPIYMGTTSNWSEFVVEKYDREKCIQANGATHIHYWCYRSDKLGLAEENKTDLIAAIATTRNDWNEGTE